MATEVACTGIKKSHYEYFHKLQSMGITPLLFPLYVYVRSKPRIRPRPIHHQNETQQIDSGQTLSQKLNAGDYS